MTEQEGVIKFQLSYQQAELTAAADVSELNAWRTLCVQLGMLGLHPLRYDNYGFGNISQRLPGTDQFLISGTQTGGKAVLTAADYALVSHCQPELNQIAASGPCKPSDELQLPQTAAEIPYGTIEMAAEVARLFSATTVTRQGIFTMAGHEDGVVTFGSTGATAFQVLAECYAKALMLGAEPNL
ncbi:MAG: aldolase [Alishewanella sp. 32-51-5]|nr:MAG: aldolase [Alishewanella sp. 32-51-5]